MKRLFIYAFFLLGSLINRVSFGSEETCNGGVMTPGEFEVFEATRQTITSQEELENKIETLKRKLLTLRKGSDSSDFIKAVFATQNALNHSDRFLQFLSDQAYPAGLPSMEKPLTDRKYEALTGEHLMAIFNLGRDHHFAEG